jgi:nicotinamidase-related amidase
MLLKADTAHLLIVDIQARLLPAMSDPDAVTRQTIILAKAAGQLGVPITISEHCADKIGASDSGVTNAAAMAHVMPKTTFSCLADEGIAGHVDALAREGRRQLLICGIEAHVCVLQSAIAAFNAGYDVFLVTDAIMSRQVESRDIAITRMVQAGIIPVTTEMVLFEWLERAGSPAFKSLLSLIR